MQQAVELSGTDPAKRVLVVDDDPDFANSLGELIASRACEVEIVTSMQAAYPVLEAFMPDVALIDVRLGNADGNVLLADIMSRPFPPTCIMITGYSSTAVAIESLKAGAYDYLTKPLSPDAVFSALDRSFERIRLEAERTEALNELDARNRELVGINRRLHRVVESMGDLTRCTSVSGLCRQVLEKIAGSLGVEGGSVYTREGDRLVLEYSLDPGHAPAVIPMPLNINSVLGRVIERGEAVLVSDAASSDGLMLSGWSGYRDESLLALPLTGQDGDIIGVLSLHTKQQPPFTTQDRDVARILLKAGSETLRALKALEDLQASQSMLQMVMDANPDCIRVLDRDCNLVQINPAGLAYIEVDSIDQIENSSCTGSIIDPEYRDAFERLADNVYKGESGTIECSMTGMRGTRRWIEVNAVPLRNSLQNIVGCLSVSRDITQRREMADELQKSRSLLQLIIDSIPECVRVLDGKGNVMQMNKAGLDMIGAESFEQVHGACIYTLISPEYREAARKMNEQAVKEGLTGKMEYSCRGLQDQEIWVDTHTSPLRNANQEIIGVLCVTRDITGDKRAKEIARQQEMQLMQASKMASLGTLVAGVAHEINNPNQTIQINSGLLGEVWKDTQKVLDEHVIAHGPVKLGGLQYSGALGAHTDLINDINVAAVQIKTIVGRLRIFARPYDGIHGSITGTQVQINDAVEPAIALLRHAIRKGTDNFHISLEDDLPEIQCNRQQLQQIVINLVLNALEALPDRSCGIWVDTRFDAEQSCVELIVKDEGAGIKPEDLGQVLEPFYTTKREQGGTGLGLSITHSLLKDLGGKIHFESEPGKGTLVVVSLPVVRH